MKLPVLNISVSLNEIPDKIAVAVELGNCKQHCKGCHSPWLSIQIHHDCWMDLEMLMYNINKKIKQGADAIVLMGGTANGIKPDDLVETINILSHYAPVGLYSGLPYAANIHEYLRKHAKLTWLKTGEFIEEKGGMNEETTNQKFFVKEKDKWVEVTHLLRKETHKNRYRKEN